MRPGAIASGAGLVQRVLGGLGLVLTGLAAGWALSRFALAPLILPIAATIGALLLLLVLRGGSSLFFGTVVGVLLGYMFCGKGFAYVGVFPVYVGELALLLGGATTAILLVAGRLGERDIARFFRPVLGLLAAFLVWQAIRTVPYFRTYGMNAARDAVLWGYAAYAILIYLLVPRSAVDRFVGLYARLLPVFLLWLPVGLLLSKIVPLPFKFPGSPVPLIALKSGTTGVHLGGVAAFMLLGVHPSIRRWSRFVSWGMWVLWVVSWVGYGASNRACLLSGLAGICVVFLLRPRTAWHRPVFLGLFLLTMLFLTGFGIDLPNAPQDIDFDQMEENFESLTGTGEGQLERTKQWRLSWWSAILEDTFGGKYFWGGKGYGINLSDDYGFAVVRGNRSPHNVNMTVLARSGVPGLLLWLAFLAGIVITLLRRIPLARGAEADPDSTLAIWYVAYLTSLLVDAFFAVIIEGPMGGIWFWSLIGMVLVCFPPGRRSPGVHLAGSSSGIRML